MLKRNSADLAWQIGSVIALSLAHVRKKGADQSSKSWAWSRSPSVISKESNFVVVYRAVVLIPPDRWCARWLLCCESRLRRVWEQAVPERTVSLPNSLNYAVSRRRGRQAHPFSLPIRSITLPSWVKTRTRFDNCSVIRALARVANGFFGKPSGTLAQKRFNPTMARWLIFLSVAGCDQPTWLHDNAITDPMSQGMSVMWIRMWRCMTDSFLFTGRNLCNSQIACCCMQFNHQM